MDELLASGWQGYGSNNNCLVSEDGTKVWFNDFGIWRVDHFLKDTEFVTDCSFWEHDGIVKKRKIWTKDISSNFTANLWSFTEITVNSLANARCLKMEN